MLTSLILGLFTGLSLIVAIGAQNAFVLRQGILRQHLLPVVLICGLTDAILETLGVAGIGFVVEKAPILLQIVRWGGVVFLLWYSYSSFRKVFKPEGLTLENSKSKSLKTTVLATLAITYLNPHVYLDTMVLMGSIGVSQGDPEKWWFAAGGAIASVGWFFLLGYSARSLTRFFTSTRSWQILDGLVGFTMLLIAARLIFGEI